MARSDAPEVRESMDAEDGGHGFGIVPVGRLVDEVVGAAGGEQRGPVVEAGGIRGVHGHRWCWGCPCEDAV